ncbi:9004_t:CDS:2 [Scutellospora calospora]|uniref:9004_t:CDS:1 n=1 Tax=Scutellospora calospora TaxID=85575 RepID=A0ACA9KU61_9GLOM|nr:9004_t:CDS:2 [Scutellospora calospora]
MNNHSPPLISPYIQRKNSATTGGGTKTQKRPKATKSHTAPPASSGRVTKRNSVSNATKAGKGESSTRGAGRGGRGGRGGSTRGRKPSLQRQPPGSLMLEHLESASVHSTATTPASSTPSRDIAPQTPGEEIDQYIRQDEEITDTDLEKTNKDVKPSMNNTTFSKEQTERFEVYRRSALSKPNIKKLVSGILGQPCSNNISIVVAGFSKIFIGEIVEKALDIKKEWGSEGPLSPDHIREAFRRYKQETGFTIHNYQKRLLRR